MSETKIYSVGERLTNIVAERKSQHNLKTQAQLEDIALCFEKRPSALCISWEGTSEISTELTNDALKILGERGFIARNRDRDYTWDIAVDTSIWK